MGVNTTIEGDPKVFEYADMYLVCHSCGHRMKIFESVKGGMQINLFTTDKHTLTLTCENCGNELELLYEEAEPPKEIEDEENEEIQSEITEDSEQESEEEELEIKEEPQDEQVPEESKTEE